MGLFARKVDTNKSLYVFFRKRLVGAFEEILKLSGGITSDIKKTLNQINNEIQVEIRAGRLPKDSNLADFSLLVSNLDVMNAKDLRFQLQKFIKKYDNEMKNMGHL